jgi:hypothetical protein
MFKKLLFACLFLSIGTVYGQDAPVQSEPDAPVGDVVKPNPTNEPIPSGPLPGSNDSEVKTDPNASPILPTELPKTEPKVDPVPGVDPNEGQVIEPAAPHGPEAPVPVTAPAPVH